jgi:hypothetical protein
MKTDGLGSGDRTDVGSGTLVLAIALFAVIASLFDILADYRSGTEPPHLITEVVVMALALVGLALLWAQFVSVQGRGEQLTG